MDIANLLQPFANQLTYICSLVLATFAITIIFKTSTTTNFAQGAVAAFGCYFGTSFLVNYNVPIWIAIIISVIFGIALGVFIDLVIFRNGRYVNLVGKQIITMGLVTIIANIVPILFFYAEEPYIPPFITGEVLIPVGQSTVRLSYHAIVSVGITIVVLTVLFLLLRFSKWGLGVRTTASNEYVAQMMGVNTYVITAASWGIAGGLGALAALIYVSGPGGLTGPYFMTEFQVNAFLAGILGGFGTFFGPVIAAVIIPLSKTIIGLFALIDGMTFLTSYQTVIVYILLLIIILIKPNGIFGVKIAKKV